METLISKRDLEGIISQIVQDSQVFAPVIQDGIKTYRMIAHHEQINWGDGNCHRSPKEFFFPMTEPIFGFTQARDGVKIEPIENHSKKRVLIGVRPCDAFALYILDRVFSWDYEDELYLTLRKNTVIIGLACVKPEPFCFCTATHISPFEERGSDILLTDLGNDTFHAKVITQRGEQFLKPFTKYCKDVPADVALKRETMIKEVVSHMPPPLPLAEIKSWMDLHFDHPLWEELAAGCLGCGTCAYLCPTCHCFDLTDETTGYAGQRMRNWDSCAFDHFTKMAAHQPRIFQWQRFRQRVMHKFKYYIDKFSHLACVGCGRCRALCPAGKDIVQVLGEIRKQMDISQSEPMVIKKGRKQ